MESKPFLKDYVEFLLAQNTELRRQLNDMQETQDKILASVHSPVSAYEEMLNILTALPGEIDAFYEKVEALFISFKTLLIRKSQMVHLVEKMTKATDPSGKFNTDLFELASSSSLYEQNSGPRANKKATPPISCGDTKNRQLWCSTWSKYPIYGVVGGYSDKTERTSLGNFNKIGDDEAGTSSKLRILSFSIKERRRLSPILEASPETINSDLRSNISKELEIPLERINLNNKLLEESPKTIFKGPKTWRESISSFRRHSKSQGKPVFFEENDNLDVKLKVEGNEPAQVPKNDPLEGPSWLHEDNSGMKSPHSRFVNYRRRKRRLASMFRSPEAYLAYTEDRAKEQDKFYEHHEEMDDERVSGSPEECTYPSLKNGGHKSSSKKRSRVSKRCNELEPGTNVGMESTSGEVRKEMLVSLEESPLAKASGEKNKLKTNKEKNKSNSPASTLAENEGRKKRKAAPAFKMTEPRLNVKLRRN